MNKLRVNNNAKPILEIQNLSFQFGSNVVLKNLNFKINKNENWQISGPSGTGKTTLAKIISEKLKILKETLKSILMKIQN